MTRISRIDLNLQNNYPVKQTNRRAFASPMKSDEVSFTGGKIPSQIGSDAILGIIRKCQELLVKGHEELVNDLISLVQAGKINEALEQLSNSTLPNGIIKKAKNGTKIVARNWDGSPVEHMFYNVPGFKNLGLLKDLDKNGRVDIFQKAFGTQPKTTVGMVGWTNIKPENVLGGTSLSKAELTAKYEQAIDKFYSPIDKYFVEGLGINPSDRALVSSVSYSGVDKAIMDLGQSKNINTLTVTPFDYSIYGRNEHPFPVVLTDTIPQYVKVYGGLSDNIVVTGGRDHAFKFDAGGKWLRQTAGKAIPVDVLKDYEGIVVPALINGKVENAAALAYESFSNPLPTGLVQGFKKLPSDSLKQDLTHPAQKALATAMWDGLVKNGFVLK